MKKLSVWWCAALSAALVASACGGGRSGADESSESPPSEGDSAADPDDKADQPAFGGDGMAQMAMMSSMLAGALDKPGPYEEPRSGNGYEDGEPYRAVVELSGAVTELASFDLFSGATGTELRAIGGRLRELAGDDQVNGLVLRFGELGIDLARAGELREALQDFRKLGEKTIACHAESVSNATYYVMTACDSIAIVRGGQVVVTGAAAMPVHFKRMLDSVGIEPDFLHVGAFKGAAEPLTRDKPSPEMVETLRAVVDANYETLAQGIAEGRKLAPDAVEGLIDTAMFSAEQAVEVGLADGISLFEELLAADPSPWKKVAVVDQEQPGFGQLMKFLGTMPSTVSGQERIALVYAVGNVIDGAGQGMIGARSEIASRTLAPALRALAADEGVKAVVLRIDSGGGSALASEVIWNAVQELKAADKTVVVSMAGVAASGGYYIAAGADRIFASPTTVTGSIGVVGGKLAMAGALKKAGVATYPIGRGERAMLFAGVGRWSPGERAAIQRSMEQVYELFVGRVSAGRSMTPEQVEPIAQGRAWTGRDALERGLVDELGGLESALAFARDQAGVGDDILIDVYPPEPNLRDIVTSMGQVSSPLGVLGADDWLARAARTIGPAGAQVLEGTLRQLLLLQEQPLQAVLYWPVVVQ